MASTVSSAIKAALFDTPPRVSTVHAGVPASFDAVIEKGLVADPAQASWRQVDAWLDSLVRS